MKGRKERETAERTADHSYALSFLSPLFSFSTVFPSLMLVDAEGEAGAAMPEGRFTISLVPPPFFFPFFPFRPPFSLLGPRQRS